MEDVKQRFVNSLSIAFKMVAVLWVVHLFQVISNWDLGYMGIWPRRIFGFKGIFLAPLIHADFQHLISNSIPLFVLSTTIFFFYRRVAAPSIIMIYLLTGLSVWLLGRPVFHIGASGVVYGMVAFVFWNGIFRRNIKSIILAAIITMLYSGYFYGILPNQEGISWESHLLGGVMGIFASYWYKEAIEADEAPKRYSWEDEDPGEGKYFLDRNTFEMTKDQRRQLWE